MNHVYDSAQKVMFVRHRQNTMNEVRALEEEYGAELDLRAGANGKIIVHHDPWKDGADFEDWLDAYCMRKHDGPLILNTKEDGLETQIVKMCEANGLSNYFFLDTALPTLVKWTIKENSRFFACRVSEFEPLEAVSSFRGLADWLWVDCFDGKPMDAEKLKAVINDFKVCLVSPEMQGAGTQNLKSFEPLFRIASAVCTKVPELWKEMFL